MGIEMEENMEPKEERYGGADVPAATLEQTSAMEQDTAAISPRKDERTWGQTIDMLRETHTICMREICQQLKSSRTWVAKYIIPYLDKLYLDTGFRGGKMTTKSWTHVAAIMLQDSTYLNNSLWCHEEQFRQLIRNSVVSVTKQTKRVPIELLVKNKRVFAAQYNEVLEEIEMTKKQLHVGGYNKGLIKEIREQEKLLEAIADDYLSDIGKQIMKANMINITQRSKTIPVNVPLPDIPIRDWEALHDRKSYGDTDEIILRHFFKQGYIRVELHIPDPKEMDDPAAIYDDNIEAIWHSKKCSKKIYYIPDPEPLRHLYVDRYVTIAESIWKRYEKEMLP